MGWEEKINDVFLRRAFKPSISTYAWKRTDIEKLFEETMLCNIAVEKVEVWVFEDQKITSLTPLKSGEISVFNFKPQIKKEEDWYDFVERSSKEALGKIAEWDLEKTGRRDIQSRIWYNINFKEEN